MITIEQMAQVHTLEGALHQLRLALAKQIQAAEIARGHFRCHTSVPKRKHRQTKVFQGQEEGREGNARDRAGHAE